MSNIPLLWMCFEFIYLLHVVIINLLITDKMASSSQFMHEIVFRRPGLRHFINPLPINNFEQVDVASLPGILLSNNFCFDAQVGNVLKLCGQRVYLLKVLCEQCLSRGQLHAVFLALIVSRDYVLPCHLGVVFSVVSKLERLMLC